MTETDFQAATDNLPNLLAENGQQRISKFRSDLLELEIGPLVQRHITTGPSFLLDDDRYHLLRARVATEFALHPNEVLMVGSAKLGFSIVRKQRYRPFGEESDIDLAVVSSQLNTVHRHGEDVIFVTDNNSDFPTEEDGTLHKGKGSVKARGQVLNYQIRSNWSQAPFCATTTPLKGDEPPRRGAST